LAFKPLDAAIGLEREGDVCWVVGVGEGKGDRGQDGLRVGEEVWINVCWIRETKDGGRGNGRGVVCGNAVYDLLNERDA